MSNSNLQTLTGDSADGDFTAVTGTTQGDKRGLDITPLTDSWLSTKLGNKIEVAYPTTTTETYTFKDGATTLYVLLVTYTTATKDILSSVERTA